MLTPTLPSPPTSPTVPAPEVIIGVAGPPVALHPEILNGFEEALAAVLPAVNPSTKSTNSSSPVEIEELVSFCPENSESHLGCFQDMGLPSPDTLEYTEPCILDGFLDDDQLHSLSPSFDSVDFLQPDIVDPPSVDSEVGQEEQSVDTSISISTDTRPSRSLLLDYYRLPHPSTLPFQDMESMLIQHYFQHICVLFSGFDSALNPFRKAVREVYQDCPSIYYGIQSMAAAHLGNNFPHMTATGLELQSKAYSFLQDELELASVDDANYGRTLLSILLLGLSTSWHECGSLGEEFLAKARSLILPKLITSAENDTAQRRNQFFEEALIYWEMLMGFVTPDFSPPRTITSERQPSPPSRRAGDGKILPHPWTGVAPKVLMLFAEVGRVVHQERIMHLYGAVHPLKTQENEKWASTLEEDLLLADYPLTDELMDLGDERTSKHDFIVLAEAYRCAGLLEIYRVFPGILRKRLDGDQSNWTKRMDFSFPTPRFGSNYEETDTKFWISSLALHILDGLESIPSTSGTCCLQQILLVTAASELKFEFSIDYFDLYANKDNIQHARNFVNQRMTEYALRLPAKPLRREIDLVKEVWRRFDSGHDVFWMDVMIEKGWQTVMG